jgi:hypothetical protein
VSFARSINESVKDNGLAVIVVAASAIGSVIVVTVVVVVSVEVTANDEFPSLAVSISTQLAQATMGNWDWNAILVGPLAVGFYLCFLSAIDAQAK